MKKLMDEEIIKALECCGKEYSCERCILNTWLNKKRDCVGTILGGALDLINRQQAELERLNIELQAMRNAANSYKIENERLEKILDTRCDKCPAATTAIAELAEKVKDLFYPEDEVREEINNLAQEMVGNADV